MIPYNPQNWYWAVAGNAAQVYASAAGDYVPVTDRAYVKWLEEGTPTSIDTEKNLGEVLGQAGARLPVPPAIREGYKDVLIREIGPATAAVLLDHENRIRNLEGQAPITLNDLRDLARKSI